MKKVTDLIYKKGKFIEAEGFVYNNGVVSALLVREGYQDWHAYERSSGLHITSRTNKDGLIEFIDGHIERITKSLYVEKVQEYQSAKEQLLHKDILNNILIGG